MPGPVLTTFLVFTLHVLVFINWFIIVTNLVVLIKTAESPPIVAIMSKTWQKQKQNLNFC